ncbi:MAG: hypothetical protein R2705_09760 [Ilumatobacteraceae bacterium]
MAWLEPLVEIELDGVRHGIGPVSVDAIGELPASPRRRPAPHPGYVGPIDHLAWMQGQQRVTFASLGVVDPRSCEDHERRGGLRGLRTALAMTPDEVVTAVTDSGLRGAAAPPSHRHQVEHGGLHAGRSTVRLLQRRRGRQRHLRRPHAHGG